MKVVPLSDFVVKISLIAHESVEIEHVLKARSVFEAKCCANQSNILFFQERAYYFFNQVTLYSNIANAVVIPCR